MKMEEGSFAFSIWKKPPVKVYVGVFLFNITNSERFLSGQDKKIKVTEIGPYVYRYIYSSYLFIYLYQFSLYFSFIK